MLYSHACPRRRRRSGGGRAPGDAAPPAAVLHVRLAPPELVVLELVLQQQQPQPALLVLVLFVLQQQQQPAAVLVLLVVFQLRRWLRVRGARAAEPVSQAPARCMGVHRWRSLCALLLPVPACQEPREVTVTQRLSPCRSPPPFPPPLVVAWLTEPSGAGLRPHTPTPP